MTRRFTDEMTSGLQCLTCGRDVRDGTADEAVVAHSNGAHIVASRGTCAATAYGNPNGTADRLLPLTERVAEWDGD